MEIKLSEFPRLIKEFKDSGDYSDFKKVKVALLSSYTIQNIKTPLEYHLLSNKFKPNIKVGGYDQINQELVDGSSWLFDFKPDIITIALSTDSLLKGVEYRLGVDSFKDILVDCKSKISALLDSISAYSQPSKILLTLLDYPVYSPFGLKDVSMDDGFNALVRKCNDLIIEYSRKNGKVIPINFDKVCKQVGLNNLTDHKLNYIGKIFLSNDAANVFSKEIVAYINASFGNVKKCMVLDLDNTLWGGVIGEDGIDGIKIDDSTIGSIYTDIQKIIKNLKQSGVLLAIVSKNNKADVMPVFEKKKSMVLKKDDFITMRINWKTKSENILNISKELNLGIDSFVFLDDNPAERLEVKSNLPDINIVDFPSDVSKLPEILRTMTYFSSISLTEEDKIRHELYLQENKRKSLKKTTSLHNYLKELEIRVSVKKDDIKSVDRISQLINKTNQFNLRTQRYTLEQVQSMFNSDVCSIYSVRVFDKFGEMGLTGILILRLVDKSKNEYFIDTFLMSCRVLSRGIESQFLCEIVKDLPQDAILKAEYLKTPKNNMVESFYDQLGFELIKSSEEKKNYSQVINKVNLKNNDWITVE